MAASVSTPIVPSTVGREILESLNQALSRIDRPSSFYVIGRAPAMLPGLEVDGLGPVGLPLAVKQAKDLIKHCDRAPYGKGTKTIVDTNVRRVWRMEPDRFSLKNPDWEKFVEATVAKVQDGLGLEKQKLESHLYDLLLYEPGSFFQSHRDGEKLDRMVATLVIELPSSHEGGELVVRHDRQEHTIDFGGPDASPFHVHFAAFYADCEHEIRPLRKGYRLCLVYNLTLAKSQKPISAPRVSEYVESISPVVQKWANEDSASKLVATLDHQYTKDGIAWDALKGVDRVKAQVLLEAARGAGCRAFLAILTFWESGSAEDSGGGYGYGRRRRWYNEQDDDRKNANEHVMGEIYDTSLTANHLTDSTGKNLPIEKLHVEEGELLDPQSLKSVKPEEEFEGYTGNAGMTLERWYRHAAIILWPERRHFEILCDRDPSDVVPVLKQMLTQCQESTAKDSAALLDQCHALASAILAKWSENRYARDDPQDPGNADLSKSLVSLGDPMLISRFLGDVMIKDIAVDPGESVVTFCRDHGWGTFRKELQAVMKSTTTETIERNVRLLEQLSSAKPRKKEGWGELCEILAQELVSAIESLDQSSSRADWRSREVKRVDVLTGLARSLMAIERYDLLSRVVADALALPKTYPLKLAHIPALVGLRPWLKKNIKKACAPLAQWVASCREQLESLTAQLPQEPTDFHRPAEVECKCSNCAELNRFLGDPRESVHRFSVRKDERTHLEYGIRDHHCDLDLRTERNRSPHTLVCTKNMASYQERLKMYHQDQEHLATVRSIEASLPK